MTSLLRGDRIVVGVDGTSASAAAVRYAADEAARTGLPLECVHVMPGALTLAARADRLYPLTPAESQRIGERVLEEAREVADAVLKGAQPVTTTLREGDRVARMVAALAGARVAVLGNQRRSLADRIATGSLAAGVTTRASTPVVVVPEHWLGGAPKGAIAVGIKDCADSHGLMRRAFEAASDHDARLVIVHSWEFPTLYDDLIASRVDMELWNRDTRAALETLIDAVAPDFPGVPYEVHLAHGQAAGVLERASERADLLLIARRPHAFPLGYLGGTGRALLRETACPIEILPPANMPVWSEGAGLEHDGRLTPAATV